MKQVISVVGARPNFMKVAPIHRAFEQRKGEFTHRIVHTGQHYDAAMSDAFFTDLNMPQPSWYLGVGSSSHAQQTAAVMTGLEDVFNGEKPDYVVVVGDVNSTLAAALVSVKMGIRTGHVESGLRSGDMSMPEEVNRRATDAVVDDLFVTEQSGLDNLIREGHAPHTIHFVGNTMIDSLLYALPQAEASPVTSQLGLSSTPYALVTLHRPSNVDDPSQLKTLLFMLQSISERISLVFPVHPRTRQRLSSLGVPLNSSKLHLIDPVGYIDFLSLMKGAQFVLTDSGGIQEETTALQVPCITARTTTERPSTTTIGSNRLVNPTSEAIEAAIADVLEGRARKGMVPPLWDGQAATRIVNTIATITS